MNAIDQNPTDPFILLTDLARQPGVKRTALELVIRAGKRTVISLHGRYRLEAKDWLSWRAASDQSAPLHQFKL